MIQNRENTICALSTAQGGAINVIRISGSRAIAIASEIFIPTKGKLSEAAGYTIHFGSIVDTDGEIIDQVLLSIFRAPHSYTGEESVEISCHGSSYISSRIIQLLILHGCTSAQAGEFTFRAFLNGKMDLSQAEAVADLISSSSAANHRIAMNQMRGGFGRELSKLRDNLIHLTSLIELELDFSDHEEIEFASRDELINVSTHIESVINKLINSFQVGNAIKNGIPVAIIGETNVGKSTLLNALLHDEKAIVSNIHGTTRDVIEDTIVIGGYNFRFIDTAGIRDTSDIVESIGIERTYKKIEQASIVLWVIDASVLNTSNLTTNNNMVNSGILSRIKEKPTIILFNKSDKIPSSSQQTILKCFNNIDATKLFISAKDNHTTTEEIEKLLLNLASIPEVSNNDIIINNTRHFEALTHAHSAIERVIDGIQSNISGDFISQDLRECIHHLSDIIGDVTDTQVLSTIFSKFCIGK